MEAGKPDELWNQPITRYISLCCNYKRNLNGYPYIYYLARPKYGTADRALHRPISGTPHVGHETGSGNNFWTERAGDAIPSATPTVFDRTLLRYGAADKARHRRTSGTQNVCQETGSGNRKWKQRFNGKNWRCDYNGYPHIFDHARLTHDTDDRARRRESKMSATKPEVETGSGNNFWTEGAGDAIPTTTTTFATVSDSNNGTPDTARHPELKMSTKTVSDFELRMFLNDTVAIDPHTYHDWPIGPIYDPYDSFLTHRSIIWPR